MCLATILYQKDVNETMEFQNITRVVNDNGKITFEDLLGRSNKIEGTILEMDLVDNKILISG